MKIEIEVPEYLEHRILEQVPRLVADHYTAVAEDAVRKAIARALEEAVEGVTLERVDAEVGKLLAEGWPETTGYGERTGRVITLAERVRRALDRTDFGRVRGIEKLVEEASREAVRKELREELDAARAKFRAMIDEELIGKFRELLRKTVGIDL